MSQKRKRLILITLTGILIGLVVAILLLNPWNTTELTEAKRLELIDSWEARENGRRELKPGTGIKVAENLELYYYGTYNGYDVLFVVGNMFGTMDLYIGDEWFYYRQSAVFYLHRNGDFVLLEDAYRDGTISAKNLRKVALTHYDRVSAYASVKDEYLERGYSDRYD